LMVVKIFLLLIMSIVEFKNFHQVKIISFFSIGKIKICYIIAGTTIGSPMATTVAGFTLAGGTGYSELNDPTSIFVLSNGTMYIADSANYRVQKWLPDQPVGFTVAGGRGNGATFDKVGLVNSIFVTEQGNIYVSETSNNRVTLWYAGNTTASQLVDYIICFLISYLFIF
jgi:hypothetical protein